MKRLIIASVIAGLILSAQAYAWNDTGHKVVARIAWTHMKPQTRSAVIALLKAAPSDADLASLLPNDSRPLPVREREFFVTASTWADIVRDESAPARRAKYHKPSSHFINFFWQQPDFSEPPTDRTDLKPLPENAVERLQHFETSIFNENLQPSERSIDLAWVLHLVGDIHQPLHCSARVTPIEPEGDRGGNLFRLDDNNNLHSFWDGILNRSIRRQPVESEDAYIARLAGIITAHFPRSTMRLRLKPGRFEEWAKEGHQTAKSSIYPQSLRRNQAPSESYRRKAFLISERAIALAGYRLAEMLDRLSGS